MSLYQVFKYELQACVFHMSVTLITMLNILKGYLSE